MTMGEKEDYLKVYLGEVCFALPMNKIEEVLQDCVAAKISSDRSYIKGVLYYKGKVLPLIDVCHQNKGEVVNGNIGIIYNCLDHEVAITATSVGKIITVSSELFRKNSNKDEKTIVEIDGEIICFPLLKLFEREKS